MAGKKDDAVSEVIGVIVMVALTVILAAIIGAFVFGLAGNIAKTKLVAATAVKPNSSAIEVVYQGGQDAPSVVNLNVSVNGGPIITMGGNSSPMTVGCSTTIYSSNAFTLPTHVIVIATYNDGSQQVVLDTFV